MTSVKLQLMVYLVLFGICTLFELMVLVFTMLILDISVKKFSKIRSETHKTTVCTLAEEVNSLLSRFGSSWTLELRNYCP